MKCLSTTIWYDKGARVFRMNERVRQVDCSATSVRHFGLISVNRNWWARDPQITAKSALKICTLCANGRDVTEIWERNKIQVSNLYKDVVLGHDAKFALLYEQVAGLLVFVQPHIGVNKLLRTRIYADTFTSVVMIVMVYYGLRLSGKRNNNAA